MHPKFRYLPLHPSLNFRPLTHREAVKSLYKRSLQSVQDRYGRLGPLEVGYRKLLVREEFQKNLGLRDMKVIKKLMADKEAEIFPEYGEEEIKYPFSEGGIAFLREFNYNDILLDHWHPLQKAQYPEFFAKREELKEEYLKLYEETYGDLLKGLGIEKHELYGSKPHDWKEEDEPKLEAK